MLKYLSSDFDLLEAACKMPPPCVVMIAAKMWADEEVVDLSRNVAGQFLPSPLFHLLDDADPQDILEVSEKIVGYFTLCDLVGDFPPLLVKYFQSMYLLGLSPLVNKREAYAGWLISSYGQDAGDGIAYVGYLLSHGRGVDCEIEALIRNLTLYNAGGHASE